MSTVRMRYTDTGYPTPSNWESRDLGEEGQYTVPLVWTRQGQLVERTITFESSAGCRRDVLAVMGNLEPTP